MAEKRVAEAIVKVKVLSFMRRFGVFCVFGIYVMANKHFTRQIMMALCDFLKYLVERSLHR
jgi:hypothetical protein